MLFQCLSIKSKYGTVIITFCHDIKYLLTRLVIGQLSQGRHDLYHLCEWLQVPTPQPLSLRAS